MDAVALVVSTSSPWGRLQPADPTPAPHEDHAHLARQPAIIYAREQWTSNINKAVGENVSSRRLSHERYASPAINGCMTSRRGGWHARQFHVADEQDAKVRRRPVGLGRVKRPAGHQIIGRSS